MMMLSKLFFFISALTAALQVSSFSLTSLDKSQFHTSSQLSAEASISRRGAVGSIFTLATLGVTNFPLAANADVTNKVASQAALRNIKRTVKELEKLEFIAADNKYAELKEGLRVPPITDVRKNCNVLIRGGEDGPESEALKSGYASFIKSLEELDSKASLGIRGRKDINLIDSYDQSVKALIAFGEVADRAAGIPLQISETVESTQ